MELSQKIISALSMKPLIFATNNLHKTTEVKSLLKGEFKIMSLAEARIDIDIAEPYATLEENAREKARVIYNLTNTDCFAEDTGLEVETLRGEPGVKSARYAGEDRSFENNIDKLLSKLKTAQNRKAQFRTVICLILNKKEKIFEGICKGSIIAERKGLHGFGYDAVFVPDGATKTFAEMTLREKNRFSHRKKAIEKLTAFLKTEQTS